MSTKIKTAFNLLFLLITVFGLCTGPFVLVRSYDQMARMHWTMGLVSWLALAVYTVYFCRKLIKSGARRV